MQHNVLTGKTVFITGGSRRLGAAMVKKLHQAGMNIALHYRHSRQAAETLAAELNAQRADSVSLHQADLLEFASYQALIASVIERWQRLDAIINNASSFYPTAIGDITEQHWDDLLGSNLKAPLFISQAAAPYLKHSRGCIINLVDIHASRPLKAYPVYSIAKAGLQMLTLSLARELGPEVRVNGIAPGAIMLPEAEKNVAMHKELIQRTALKREGNPEDIAKTALFLLRDADYITGQIIAVDGGRSLSN